MHSASISSSLRTNRCTSRGYPAPASSSHLYAYNQHRLLARFHTFLLALSDDHLAAWRSLFTGADCSRVSLHQQNVPSEAYLHRAYIVVPVLPPRPFDCYLISRSAKDIQRQRILGRWFMCFLQFISLLARSRSCLSRNWPQEKIIPIGFSNPIIEVH